MSEGMPSESPLMESPVSTETAPEVPTSVPVVAASVTPDVEPDHSVAALHAKVDKINAEIDSIKEIVVAVGPMIETLDQELKTKGLAGFVAAIMKGVF